MSEDDVVASQFRFREEQVLAAESEACRVQQQKLDVLANLNLKMLENLKASDAKIQAEINAVRDAMSEIGMVKI